LDSPLPPTYFFGFEFPNLVIPVRKKMEKNSENSKNK